AAKAARSRRRRNPTVPVNRVHRCVAIHPCRVDRRPPATRDVRVGGTSSPPARSANPRPHAPCRAVDHLVSARNPRLSPQCFLTELRFLIELRCSRHLVPCVASVVEAGIHRREPCNWARNSGVICFPTRSTNNVIS